MVTPDKDPEAQQHAPAAATRGQVITLILMSIASSVGLILSMKVVMTGYQCNAVLFLSAIHFLATALFTRIAAYYGVFTPKRDMPQKELWLLGAFGAASIVFMNFNLRLNSVGFYQMTKLLCIPWMVTVQRTQSGKRISLETLAALVAILSGVGLVTVTDVAVNALGFLAGCLAVGTTAQFQLWQGSKQAQFQISAIQILDSVMPYQLAVCSVFAVLMETNLLFQTDALVPKDPEIVWGFGFYFAVFITCLLAVAVNYVTYALIGKTSAVTYQVVGHFKTILTLMGGYFLFVSDSDKEISTSRQFFNFLGIVVALIGMILYGDVKTNAATGQTLLGKHLPQIDWKKEF